MTENKSSSNYAKMIVKAWKDPKFKEQLLKDPENTLASEGIQLPRDIKITAYENTDKQFNLVIPLKPDQELDLSQEQLEAIAGGQDLRPETMRWTPSCSS